MDGVFGLAFGRPSVSKAVKIALGCSLAVLLARLLELSSATAVVTITLLSVQRTKKDTLRAALRRSLAFFRLPRPRAAAVFSAAVFRARAGPVPSPVRAGLPVAGH